MQDTIRTNAKNRKEDKPLQIVNYKFTPSMEFRIPFYSYIQPKLEDLMEVYRTACKIEGDNDMISERIIKEISRWTTRLAENEEVRSFIYDFWDLDNVAKEDIDPDEVYTFPYDIAETGKYDAIRRFDNLIERLGYINVLNNSEADDVAFENTF